MANLEELVKDLKSRLKRDADPVVVISDYDGPIPIVDADLNKDVLAKGDERAKILGGFKRHKSKGDGNCIFRSHSQAIVGHQNLHKSFRQGTAALMRRDKTRYMGNMKPFQYNNLVKDAVEKKDTSIGKQAQQALADLLRARVTYIHATSPKLIHEVTPNDGQIFYEINLGVIPGHANTLGREHLYKYHFED